MHANTVWMHVFITSIKDLQLALSLSLISIAVFLHASFRTQTIPCLRNHLVIDCCVCMDVRTYVGMAGSCLFTSYGAIIEQLNVWIFEYMNPEGNRNDGHCSIPKHTKWSIWNKVMSTTGKLLSPDIESL